MFSGTVLVKTAGREVESHKTANMEAVINKKIPIVLVGTFCVNQFLKSSLIYLTKKISAEKMDNPNIEQ